MESAWAMILFPALRTANRRDRWRPPFPAGSETLTLLRAPDCSSRVVKTCLISLRLNRVSDLQSRQAGHWPPRGPASLAGTQGPGAAGVLETVGGAAPPGGLAPGAPSPWARARLCPARRGGGPRAGPGKGTAAGLRPELRARVGIGTAPLARCGISGSPPPHP